MPSKWTCGEGTIEITNQECWFVRCNGKYMGTILRHASTPTQYRYSIPDQTYTPKPFPTVECAMSAMRATLRWRRKKQRQQKPLDTDS